MFLRKYQRTKDGKQHTYFAPGDSAGLPLPLAAGAPE
jgi:hypothetical protein